MLDPAKNTDQQVAYYDALTQFFEGDPADTLMKLRSFSLYTPRQVTTDFLVRYELFKMIVDVPGNVMEFGVFNGQGLMSYAQFSAILEPNHLNRKIYGFDTFEGFQSLAQEDAKGTSPFLTQGGFQVDSVARLEEAIRLYDANRFIGHIPKVQLIQGDVLETLTPFLAENPQVLVALLYLDMDIYRPTKHVLETLYDRVPKGGIVAFDELNMKDYAGETLALLDTLGVGQIALKRLPFCSRISYFVK